MAFELPSLPYVEDALAPVLSKETIEFHYGKHHRGYVNKLNELMADAADTPDLRTLITTSDGAVFNNAAQVWNHTFFWQCMSPSASGGPKNALADAIAEQFGGLDGLKAEFMAAAASNFGSGWTWLTRAGEGELSIVNTSNADTPLRGGFEPILTCDVWLESS